MDSGRPRPMLLGPMMAAMAALSARQHGKTAAAHEHMTRAVGAVGKPKAYRPQKNKKLRVRHSATYRTGGPPKASLRNLPGRQFPEYVKWEERRRAREAANGR